MNIKNLLCVVSAVALFGSVTAQAQGLTDLAKAEKKRRAQVQKTGGAAKVYTESDKSSSASSDGGVSVASAPEGAGAPGAAPGAAPATGKKEKTPEEIAAEKQKEWNDKVTAAQTQITELEGTISRNERNLASLDPELVAIGREHRELVREKVVPAHYLQQFDLWAGGLPAVPPGPAVQ